MKIIIPHIVLVLLFFQACAQPVENTVSHELKTYNFVNLPEGVSNIQFKLYPENTTIQAGYYQDLSEVKNETEEDLLRSSLSEQSLEWYRFNRDYEKESDLETDHMKYYNIWIEKKAYYDLLSMFSFNYDGLEFRIVYLGYYSDKTIPLISPETMVKREGRWYITKDDPSDINGLNIGMSFTQPSSVYRIFNKTPANDGEKALLEQSLNEDGELDFNMLSTSLRNIKEQAETNQDIEALILKSLFDD